MTIYFFYPSKILGGVEMLFARLADNLSENYKVVVIDYENGIYNKILTNYKYDINIVSKRKIILNDFDLVITPPSDFILLKKYLYLSNKTKLLFWYLQPYNSVHFFPKLFLNTQYSNKYFLRLINKFLFFDYYKKTKLLIKKANEESGVIYMDSNVLDFNDFFFSLDTANPVFVKIPVELNSLVTSKKSPNNIINLCWVGRLKHDALPILKRLILDLESTQKKYFNTINFYIIGDGICRPDLNVFTDNIIGINFFYKGTLSPTDLDHFLDNNIDCLFAFGTSALEGGKLGIPVCLLDPSYRDLKHNEYLYKWLFESRNFKLGRLINHYNNLPPENTKSIDEVLFGLKNSHHELSFNTYNYVFKNHNIDQTLKDLKSSISNCTFFYSTAKSYISAPTLRTVINFFKNN